MLNNSSVAVFIDAENIHYSALNHYSQTPNWSWIVKACKEYGRISLIQAFGDWVELSKEVSEIRRNGIQPIFVPLSQDGKSSLDSFLIVSVMKLFFQNNTIDTLVLASGDRDYIPMIAELKTLGKKVIILAVPGTLSKDLTMIVDGVISYEPNMGQQSNKCNQSLDKNSAFEYIIDTLKGLEGNSDNDRWVNLANIGFSLQKKGAIFSHSNYGYSKLVEMLDDIPEIEIKNDNFDKTVAPIALARTLVGEATEEQQGTTLSGVVKSIKEGHGFSERYGSIEPDDGDKDIFFHSNILKNVGIKELQIGDKVSYRTYHTDMGLNAKNIEKET